MTLSNEFKTSGTHAVVERHRVDHARWFISLRWIAVVVAAILIIVAIRLVELLPEEVLLPLSGIVVTLAGLNVFYLIYHRRKEASTHLILFQSYADLLLLTLLIHFSGGIENPLVLLMIFHVIIAGITLSRGQCYVVAAVATALFAMLAWGEATGLLEHYTLKLVPHYEQHGETAHAAHDPVYVAGFTGLQGTILILTAFFVTTLAERLRQKEDQLAVLADRALTQRQLLEQALETTGTGLYVCEEDLQPVLTNGYWESWFSQDDVDGPLSRQIVGDPSPLQLTLEDGKVRVTEIEVNDLQRNARTFRATTAPLIGKENHITHVVQLVQDITDQKAAQIQMIRAGQLAAVGELAGHVAHEVNNPIAIISTKARLLLSDHRGSMSGRTAQELEKIVQLSDRVAAISQGLLSYCRPSLALRVQLDVTTPIRRALTMIEQRAGNAGIQIEDNLPQQLPPVYANEREVEQIFLNLLLNALDAMSEGGRLILSSFTTQTGRNEDEQDLHISVEDTGSGMPEEVRKRIFEPFFTTKPEGKGTGLGLSICQGLVQNYEGQIAVQSTLGEGTRVDIRLPIYHKDNHTYYG